MVNNCVTGLTYHLPFPRVDGKCQGVFIGVDNRSRVKPGSRGRMSVRLESVERYNDGLFIISLEHAPIGTWEVLNLSVDFRFLCLSFYFFG